MHSSFSYSGIDNLEAMVFAKFYNNFLISLIEQHAPTNGLILDFGTGSGAFAFKLKKKKRKIICIEPDLYLQANLIDAGYECHNTTDEIVNSSIDFIYSLNVLEHIENDAYVSQQLFRILKPGRNCLIYVPALQILFTSMDKKVGHLRRYNLKTIKNIMQNTGFIVEEAKYADCLGFFATLVYKYFGNNDGSLNIKMLKIYDRIIFPISRYLDLLCHPFFGKNLYILVRKPIGN